MSGAREPSGSSSCHHVISIEGISAVGVTVVTVIIVVILSVLLLSGPRSAAFDCVMWFLHLDNRSHGDLSGFWKKVGVEFVKKSSIEHSTICEDPESS